MITFQGRVGMQTIATSGIDSQISGKALGVDTIAPSGVNGHILGVRILISVSGMYEMEMNNSYCWGS